MPSPKPGLVRRLLAVAVAFGWLAYMHFGVEFSFIPPEPPAAQP